MDFSQVSSLLEEKSITMITDLLGQSRRFYGVDVAKIWMLKFTRLNSETEVLSVEQVND